jgi:archaellum biogenesis ATPase FlaH
LIYFKQAKDRLSLLNEMTKEEDPFIPYGNAFLDDALNGIYADDLVLITTKTGGGKTELASNIAYNAAKEKKRVYYFALEAHIGEIEARIKFKLLASEFYADKFKVNDSDFPDYQNWINGKQADIFKEYHSRIDLKIIDELSTLHTYYGDHEFNIESFEGIMGQIGDKCDLIILDHIHHMDLMDDKNENSALKRTIRQIKKIVSFYRKPAVIICQMRKADRYSKQLLPSSDDIQGASELIKIATRIIVAAPARDQIADKANVFPTYFKILKNRFSGARTYFTALSAFDSQSNKYSDKYSLGILMDDESRFEEIKTWEHPKWSNQLR